MSPKPSTSTTIATGLAIFSMFFGAGNVVFPLALGQFAKDNAIFAILGLMVTAVGVPFIGLISMTLFNGNYVNFFERIGKVPGFIVASCIMALIGPFGATPRCIALSYSTVSMYFPGIPVPVFSALACLIIFLFTYKKNKIVDVIGYILTPFFLISVAIIIIKGFWMSGAQAPVSDLDSGFVFLNGFMEGYQTMDLVGAFFFSSVVISCLEPEKQPHDHKNYKQMIFLTLKASVIGISLLGIIYFGFCYVASFFSDQLIGVGKDQLLGSLALQILGSSAAIVAIIAVALACLTTAIALAAVFAEFLHNDVTKGKLNYIPSLIITLVITFFISTLEFSGIAAFLVPILQICYPALIVLSLLNIAFKLWHFKPVKWPFWVTFILSLAGYFIGLQ